MISIQLMKHKDLNRITEIDRSEEIESIYRNKNGSLIKVPMKKTISNWSSETNEANIKLLTPILAQGGKLIGAFDGPKLAGVSVLGNSLIGENKNQLQMAFLYVSNGYRRRGIAAQLMDFMCDLAIKKGAAFLYISATETNSAVDFYLKYGCKLTDELNPELFEREPNDIHMIYRLKNHLEKESR
ncbi:GNAT family N-acetyltransferase [Metabacillus arenae]|uniref:GNAT family N-acetyltransferase n=1 Tax=Metabacillus arenae TaxID=2771434 RepID=A0A926NFR6_9BACI|nr:GNAT family N-acetyltransferase [Metabacillus arenae]MBD1379693.1 GNAT family N-acetyltransferase [Metabacillus arenae]